MSSTYIVLGNGFSIDLINKLNKNDSINLSNLFAKGDEVVWPDTKEKGFLSHKHCKNLWMLGARSHMSKDESVNFIDNIITCLNVYNFARSRQQSYAPSGKSDNVYVQAHNELSTYLKHLFIHYNNQLSDDELKKVSNDIPIIEYVKDCRSQGKTVNIITYNYDIFLERLLNLNKMAYTIEGFQKNRSKIHILKPHGSISFASKFQVPSGKQFEIKNTFDSVAMDLAKLTLIYDFSADKSLVNAIIPPSGDSNRLQGGWAYQIRELVKTCIADTTDKDALVIYGLSYGHVDRMELDDIITTVHPLINAKYINPYPSLTFDAVLSSIFVNYIHIKDAKYLLGV